MPMPVRAKYEPIDLLEPTAKSIDHERCNTLVRSFFLLGLLNNLAYVILLASAKSISEGGTSLVYIANIVPSLLVKASAPYWFASVSYHTRLLAASWIMAGAFVTVGVCTGRSLVGQLFGAAAISLQCGLGEASLLALAGKVDSSSRSLTAFSSGTGWAGPVGYLWRMLWMEWLNSKLSTMLLLAVSLAMAYGWIYFWFVAEVTTTTTTLATNNTNAPLPGDDEPDHTWQTPIISTNASRYWTPRQRLVKVLALWPYTIPLCTVYAAEYACQAGAWTAMGLPPSNVEARQHFYETSNWLYQAGVLVSRSSGTWFTIPRTVLWVLPGLQVVNLIGFVATAASTDHWWYQPAILYPWSVLTGLVGGAVYVHGYRRIVADVPEQEMEFALASTSVAEGWGILVGDIAGLFVQACLYDIQGLDGALVQCPLGAA